MESGKPSYMAEAAARLRAAHQLLDDDPKILLDPLAVSILGPEIEATIQGDLEKFQSATLRRARTLLVVRARYTEDELKAAVYKGIEQVVILGAGLDTLAYRGVEEFRNLRIFEVDHPDTQNWKLERLQIADVPMPKNVCHVGIDFDRESLPQALTNHGFNMTTPTFFSWLGVSYYLQRTSVFDMFNFISTMPISSQIVFDYLVDESELDEAGKESLASAKRQAKAHSEELRTRFISRELEVELRNIGFRDVVRLTPELATLRYLGGRADGLSVDSSLQLMSATL